VGRAEELYGTFVRDGLKAINGLVPDHVTEELFLDFKNSADLGVGIGPGLKLHDSDRKTLAKAISGFGNSEGGVIVWGVDARNVKSVGDVAQALHPIDNPKRFRSWLEGAVSGCTIPAHPHVQHHPIELNDGSGKGYVVTLFPRSFLAPHQMITGGEYKYFYRAGSAFCRRRMLSYRGCLVALTPQR
jgi:hypothetical protein